MFALVQSRCLEIQPEPHELLEISYPRRLGFIPEF